MANTCKIALILLLLPLSASAIDTGRLADAIYKAENSQRYPYGVIVAGRALEASEARRSCLRTLEHSIALHRSNGAQGDLLQFIARRYAPPNCKNDPKHLNQYWLKNVRWFYNHPTKGIK